MITPANVSFGCDPEAFFTKGGKVVGSEKVLPEKGILAPPLKYSLAHTGVVLDGVQFELHTLPSGSPVGVGRELAAAFKLLKQHLLSLPDIEVCFIPTVTVEREELATLSERARVLGCAPSLNLYGIPSIAVDGADYPQRSAGGHVQLGLNAPIFSPYDTDCDNREDLVALMDLLVGNTCVLLDRDPLASARRKNYGRPGEYRLPRHGLEYRTLSNFWIAAQPLTCFVFEMSHLAVSILSTALTQKNKIDEQLMSRVNPKKIVSAIMENDLQLAQENFTTVRDFINEVKPGPGMGLTAETLPAFDRFVEGVQEKGLQHFFPEDPVEHWCRPDEHKGWGTFLAGVK